VLPVLLLEYLQSVKGNISIFLKYILTIYLIKVIKGSQFFVSPKITVKVFGVISLDKKHFFLENKP